MKGLLLKDMYLALKHFKGYIVLVIMFALLSVAETENMFLIFYPCLLCGMMPVNLMAYDERSKWDVYTAVLPFTRAQIVASKYIFGLIGQGIILALVAISNMISMASSGGINWAYLSGVMGTLVMLSAIATAVPLPFIFRMGVEKGRMGYYVMIGLAAGGSGVAAGIFGNEISPDALPGMAFPVMVLIGVAIYAASWWLSVRFYENREL